MKISNLQGIEILNSIGNPTIQCFLSLDNGIIVKSSVPSGISTGRHEAHELRDCDRSHYNGNGVLKAIENIQTKIGPEIIGMSPDILEIDEILIQLDGMVDKSNLGSNAMLAVSIAVVRAQAICNNIQMFQLINKVFDMGEMVLPNCMFNILNGGVHVGNGISFQEFMIMPRKFKSFRESLECASNIYQSLRKILLNDKLTVGVGHEGGFAPIFNKSNHNERIVLDYLNRAIDFARYTIGDIELCIDAAASQFFDLNKNTYLVNNQALTRDELIEIYSHLVRDYPIFLIEDGMAEDDWVGWQTLTKTLGGKVQLVGDDVFVTNINRIKKGVELGVANSVLIKPNQIGTVTETVAAIKYCKENNYSTVVSHRSGETNDSFIADLVVGTAAGQLKAGAPCRGERVAKYNRLLEIEAIL